MAPIKLAKYGSVDMDFVLGVGGYDLERLMLLSLSEESHQLFSFTLFLLTIIVLLNIFFLDTHK